MTSLAPPATQPAGIWYATLITTSIKHQHIQLLNKTTQFQNKPHTNNKTPKPEFAHPHEVLHDKVSLTIASPKGGEAPLDPSSVKASESDEISQKFLKEQKSLWTNTHKLADILPRADEFDALFYVGGHGRELPTCFKRYLCYPISANNTL